MLLGIANSVNKDTERKNVLTAANSDYLEISDTNSLNWATFGEVDLEILITGTYNAINNVNTIFSFGVDNANTLRFDYRNTQNLLVFAYQKLGVNSFVYFIPITLTELQEATFKLESGILYLNGSVIQDASADNNILMDIPNKSLFIGDVDGLGAKTMDGDVFNFRANTETFSLNEGNGFNFYSEGYSITTAYQEQRLTLTKPTLVNDPFEFIFIINDVLFHEIYANNAGTQRCYINNSGVFTVGGGTKTGVFVDGVSVALNTDLRNHIGSTIKLTGTITAGLDVQYVGGLSTASSSSLTFIRWKIGSEFFNLPEGSGLTTTGTEGTVCTLVNGVTWGELPKIIGTRNTSAADPLNYNNFEVIKPI